MCSLRAPDSRKSFQAYAFNENKSIQQAHSFGHKNVWACTSNLCQ
ncbi:hypothetical protein GQ600_17539 [Phytophthora cactorum]|nr:hypothetical protein GQ600_13362 [Phytophthora cactorum]KAF1794001.1 hypothetical protein GQ600_17539 [Phytophthora cactorum]